MQPLITIEVTPDIAFKIRALAELGVFSMITGNITLNFHEGRLKSAKTESYTQVKLDPESEATYTPLVNSV